MPALPAGVAPAPPAPAAPEPGSPGPTESASLRLVLAESDVLTASLIEHRVEAVGGSAIRCESVETALRAVAQEAPDAVVVESRLPGGGGFALLQRLRQQDASRFLPVVFVSWPGNEQDVVRAFESGADDYLLKPFPPNELIARVRRHVERYRTWEEERTASAFRLAEAGIAGRYGSLSAPHWLRAVEGEGA